MHILFESFRTQPSYLFQRMMLIGGKGEWTHCEILFEEKQWIRASSWRSQGTGFKTFEPLGNPSHYEIYALESTNWQKAFAYFDTHQNPYYDVYGVLGMVYQTHLLNHPSHKFCSEACYEALLEAQLPLPLLDARLLSPLQLRRIIKQAGYPRLEFQ